MALGAERADVLQLALRESMILVLARSSARSRCAEFSTICSSSAGSRRESAGQGISGVIRHDARESSGTTPD